MTRPSSRGGMGANICPGGCAFRVWAPNADAVDVITDPKNARAYHRWRATAAGTGPATPTGSAPTTPTGRWREIFNSRAPCYGGWDDSGNADHEPWTRPDGRISINLPKWSVLMFRKTD